MLNEQEKVRLEDPMVNANEKVLILIKVIAEQEKRIAALEKRTKVKP